MNKLRLMCVALLAMLGHLSYSQSLTVSGVVSDESGVPLPGTAVVVAGTTNGTQTDFDGNYTISDVASGATLTFSYIGYVTQQVAVNGRSTINVTLLEDTAQLDEVVVVGYGAQKKEAVTGAVSTVTTEEITALPVAGFTEAIQGRMPGVQITNNGSPGSDPIVRIRGIGSITFSPNPLYVVDGYPVGSLSDFDNNDILSISVLKDASAAAIYGSRAANGVVIVTTKKGRATGDLEVNYHGYSGFAQDTKRLDLLNREEYLEFGRMLLTNGDAAFPSRWSNMNEPVYAGASQTYAQTDVDYQDAFFKTGITNQHHLSVRGGSEKSQIYGSFGYFKQEGIVVGTQYDRYNLRLNSDHQIGRGLELGQTLTVSTAYRKNEQDPGGRTPIQNLIRSIPYIPIYDPTLPGGYRAPDGSDGTDPVNPLKQALLDQSTNRGVRIFGTAYAQLNFSESLSYRFTAGVDWRQDTAKQIFPIYFDGFAGNTTADISETNTTFSGNYFSNQLNFNKSFGDHNLDAVAVAERQDNKITALGVQGERSSNDIVVLGGADNATITSGSLNEDTLYSFLTRVNYDYAGRYLLSASIRRDGSSKFADGYKWGTFPGVSAGWNIAEEPFMSGLTKLSELKIRASWGQVGFEGVSSYASQAGIQSNTTYIWGNTEATGTYYDQLANPLLEWEITEMTNVGLDVGLYNNRLQFSAEWYERSTDNLILQAPNIPSLGFTQSTVANLGAMENWGLEFQGVYYNNPDREFQWNIAANISMYRNNISALSTPGATIFAGANQDFGGTDITRTAVGDPIQSFYGWRVDGIFQSEAEIAQYDALDGDPSTSYQSNAAPGDLIFKDLDGDFEITDNDREVIGSFIPDFTYGLNFEAEYKNFFGSMFWSGVQGNDIYNALQVTRQGGLRLFNSDVAVLDAWTPTNTDTDIPRMVNGDPNKNTRTSDRFIEDGSYLRLQNLKIGYNIPVDNLDLFGKNTVKKAQIYFSATNLLTFTKYDGYDPEIGTRNNNTLTLGVDYGQYPRPRTILAGIQLGF
ncbi:SusC/RagA family TonB-linked outer membrane protein [Pseudozobellia thermophila]|uniref:TonB-linked outer membrane protein, SusC/RagA family n=1 Tax=Pseudozobellia thermophila TaxID=192903 RepID=A0A1M6CG99_9FLAO|nr:TonB-dependent receptor [Pseudozobellia thermophila]SHI59774.1 TonB-linked outer membrane protein, SusC/RagA family [Pseudozobellia thermophila]